MRTAVDTNVCSILWAGLERAPFAARMLDSAQQAGSLTISPIVFSEMLASPFVTESFVLQYLKDSDIAVDFGLSDRVWLEAGRRFREYGVRRRQSGGGDPKRTLADFVVGAHALVQADRLLTFDAGRYAVDFPELRLADTRAL